LRRGRFGVQTFAGLGDGDLGRYRQATGALDRRTEWRGLLAIGKTAANTPVT
jgi:hypothetical protein